MPRPPSASGPRAPWGPPPLAAAAAKSLSPSQRGSSPDPLLVAARGQAAMASAAGPSLSSRRGAY
eukprot:15459195-Alexandrium_andersonii.AAC.1